MHYGQVLKLVENKNTRRPCICNSKNLNNSSANDLLRQLLNDVGINFHFRERIPTMNDIFIESVQNNKPLEATNIIILIIQREYLTRVKKSLLS